MLGTHPEYDRVHVATGFTGHGFKFAAVIGSVLADFVEQGRTDHAITKHRIGRLSMS